MKNELTNLQSLINGVATNRPKETGIVAKHAARIANASNACVVLCDTSASMLDSAGGRSRIDHLHEAIDSLSVEPITLGIEFNSSPREFSWGPGVRFFPSGGTNLGPAIQLAARTKPRRTIVISDGEPQDEAAAMAAAKQITGRIDVIFVGDERNTTARNFLLSLARSTGGTVVAVDLVKIGSTGLARAVKGYLR